jgi:hypothetical protein
MREQRRVVARAGTELMDTPVRREAGGSDIGFHRAQRTSAVQAK